MANQRARRLTVHGRVQGVFFRAATRQQAQRHDLAGWVTNRSDGTVVAWLEGPADGVEAVEQWIRAGGPPRAVVEEVAAEDVEPAGHPRFEVRRG
ncbi:acylphosphatase [Egicoccus sp. AB-alg6-2]|uniref:acylphosphatase n=1 Tax=Egicoccus sp. AB-alg6-2 TaxID=3242692 RepID=UPI00359D6AAA